MKGNEEEKRVCRLRIHKNNGDIYYVTTDIEMEDCLTEEKKVNIDNFILDNIKDINTYDVLVEVQGLKHNP